MLTLGGDLSFLPFKKERKVTKPPKHNSNPFSGYTAVKIELGLTPMILDQRLLLKNVSM